MATRKVQFVEPWTEPGTGAEYIVDQVADLDESVATNLITYGWAFDTDLTVTVVPDPLPQYLTRVDASTLFAPLATVAGSAGALTRTSVKVATYSAAVGDLVPVDTATPNANVTVILPPSPATGSRIAVKHIAAGTGMAVTVACSGTDTFNKTGGATTLTLPLLNQAVTVQFDGGIWTVVSDDLPKSALDGLYVAPAGKTATTPSVLPFYNVKDYGAKGDGGTDDTAAIQAAINAADAAGGGIVWFPKGNFISGTLICKSNVAFRGVSFDLLYTGRGSRISLKAGTNGNLFTVPWGTVNNSWEHLHLEGKMANQSGTSWGIYYAYNPANSAPQTYQQAKIKSVSVKGFLSGGVYVGKWNEGVDTIDCFIANNGNHGIQIETSDCLVQGGHIMSNPGDGIRLGNSSCTVIGVSSLAGNGRGLAIVSGGTDPVEFSQMSSLTGHQVADCHIDINLNEGIFIQGNNNSIVGGFIANNSQQTNGAYANVKIDGKLSDGVTSSFGNKCVGVTFSNTGQANKPSYHVLQTNFGATANFVDLTGCTYDLTGVVNDNVNDWRVFGGTLGLTRTGHLLAQSYTANSPATNPYSATIAAGTAAGTAPPAPTITGTDLRGQVFAGTGTATAAGTLVTVTFAKPYLTAPFVVITPGNAATAAAMSAGQVYVSTTASTFSINVGVALAASQAAATYQWFYTAIG